MLSTAVLVRSHRRVVLQLEEGIPGLHTRAALRALEYATLALLLRSKQGDAEATRHVEWIDRGIVVWKSFHDNDLPESFPEGLRGLR